MQRYYFYLDSELLLVLFVAWIEQLTFNINLLGSEIGFFRVALSNFNRLLSGNYLRNMFLSVN